MTPMTFRIALRALLRNGVRSTLTTLGVVIGVGSVITMSAIGQGASRMVEKQIASLGMAHLTVRPGAMSSGGSSHGAGTGQNLTPGDADAILRESPSATAVAVMVWSRAQVVYEDLNWSPGMVLGVSPDYLTIRQWRLVEGEPFTEADVRTAEPVCLLGQTVVDNLFRGESPVGKRIRLRGLPFQVLGVLDRKGPAAGSQWDQDDTVLLPWTTAKRKIQGSAFDNVNQILVATASAAHLPRLEDEVRATLRASHRLDRAKGPEVPDDFNMTNEVDRVAANANVMDTIRNLLAATAAVSLLVGGIGIMNIMLVSVTERTREIGLRMAVGARSRDVLAQFLVEAIVLSGFGGLVGVALGVASGRFLASQYNWPTHESPDVILLAVVFSGAVGVLFGFYPAWRASRLDPIEALRHE
jgi:putative ABC transport system permease protein